MVENNLNNRGISLAELLIVISVMGIVGMLAYPKMMLAVEDTRLSAAAGRVISAVAYTRQTAINTGLIARMEINVGTDSIRLEQFHLPHEISEDVSNLNDTVVEGGTFETMEDPINPGAAYNLNLGGDGLFGGINITSAAFGADSTLTFDGLGAPADGGTVTLTCGVHQRVIQVDGLTGKVTVTN